MMVAGGVLVVLGFIGLALRQNRNADPRERLETNRQARHKPIKGEGRRGNRMVRSSLREAESSPEERARVGSSSCSCGSNLTGTAELR